MSQKIEAINSLTEYQQWVLTLFVVVLLVVLDALGFSDPVRKGLEWVSQPVFVVGRTVAWGVQKPVVMANDAYAASLRVKDLENRYSELLTQAAQVGALQEENKALRALIENTDRTLVKTVVAAPIASYGQPFVSVGQQEGVVIGNPVLVQQTLVGVVAEASAHQAKVKLLHMVDAPPILAETTSGSTGIIKGDGKRVMITEVPSDKPLAVGEVVVSGGQAGIAKGIVIGQVVEVLVSPAAPTQTAYLDQVVSFYEARVVEVRL